MKLGLFFTRNTGLRTWLGIGSQARELALYRGLRAECIHTHLFTYDTPTDAASIPCEFPTTAIRSEWFLGRSRFLRYGRYATVNQLRQLDVIKTNQLQGGREAVDAAAMAQVPLIARGGYLQSQFVRWEGRDEATVRDYQEAETYVTQRAQAVVVTTESMRSYLIETCALSPDKVHVIGNYVLDAFSPEGNLADRPKSSGGPLILTVGRHHPQKNYDLLMAALVDMPEAIWWCVGGGPLRKENEKKAERLGVQARFIDCLAHEELPSYLRTADVFVLCSRYEGHPKALLEAMACGCACVVTRGPGVDEEVDHGVTGVVVDPSPQQLREAIGGIYEDRAQRNKLGKEAALAMQDRYRLSHIVSREARLLREVYERSASIH